MVGPVRKCLIPPLLNGPEDIADALSAPFPHERDEA